MKSRKQKRLKAISLFSGAMGLDLGIEKAGIEIEACVEFDKLACDTIRMNTKTPVIQKDINQVSTKELLDAAGLARGDVSMVFGGPPCQAFSTAGARRAMNDFRGNVIVNFLRIVEEIEPKYFILENVRGILSSAMQAVPLELQREYGHIAHLKGSVIYFLVKEFAKYGYSVSFSLFNSANYGVPQQRERLIMFGHKGTRIPLPSPTHSQLGIETGNRWTTFKDAVKGLRENKMHYIALSEKDKFYLEKLGPGEYWKHLPASIVKQAMGGSYYLGGGKTGFYRRLAWDKPSPTLVTSPSMPATMLVHPTKLRPLSVEEYSRIQQFPDEWRFAGTIRSVYRQIGNAVPVGLGETAGNTIVQFDQGDVDMKREFKNVIPYSRYRGCSDFDFLPEFQKQIAALRRGTQLQLLEA